MINKFDKENDQYLISKLRKLYLTKYYLKYHSNVYEHVSMIQKLKRAF